MSDQYDEGMPLTATEILRRRDEQAARAQRKADAALVPSLARLYAILEGYLPKETPMIDLDKPLYDADGAQWFVLRKPDGGIWYDLEGRARAVDPQNNMRLLRKDGQLHGTPYPLTNTPPKPDWDRTLDVDAHDAFKIRVGRRNGKLFAEVVE